MCIKTKRNNFLILELLLLLLGSISIIDINADEDWVICHTEYDFGCEINHFSTRTEKCVEIKLHINGTTVEKYYSLRHQCMQAVLACRLYTCKSATTSLILRWKTIFVNLTLISNYSTRKTKLCSTIKCASFSYCSRKLDGSNKVGIIDQKILFYIAIKEDL